MKRILIKINNGLLKDTDLICNDINISRNKYIQEALFAFNRIHKRKILENKLKKDSHLGRKESMSVLKEFEDIEFDN